MKNWKDDRGWEAVNSEDEIEVSEQVYQEHVDRVMVDDQKPFRDHNPVCPFCGSEGSLRAHVVATVTSVPLGSDGFCLMDGHCEESDIIAIWCVNCGAEDIPTEHYFNCEEE